MTQVFRALPHHRGPCLAETTSALQPELSIKSGQVGGEQALKRHSRGRRPRLLRPLERRQVYRGEDREAGGWSGRRRWRDGIDEPVSRGLAGVLETTARYERHL